jgi:hypothetical protein
VPVPVPVPVPVRVRVRVPVPERAAGWRQERRAEDEHFRRRRRSL